MIESATGSMQYRELFWRFQDVPSCAVCGGTGPFGVIFNETRRDVPLRFVQCPTCEFIFQSPRLTDSALEEYFSSRNFICDGSQSDDAFTQHLGYHNYFDWDASYRRTAELRLAKIAKFVPPPAKLLEIGPATGAFLDEARKIGYTVSGLDISTAFAAYARKTYELDVEVGSIETHTLPNEHFDIICAFGGISCWKDFRLGLEHVNRALCPGGVFVFNYSEFYGLQRGLRGSKYFEYNHASCSLLHKKVVFDATAAQRLPIVSHSTETQVASLGRIATYLKLKTLQTLIEKLGLANFHIRVKAIGTMFVICQKPVES